MVEPGTLISLAERRRNIVAAAGSASGTHAAGAQRPIGLVLFVVAVLAIGVTISVLSSAHGMNRVIDLPPAVRTSWQRQTLSELRTFCAERAAAADIVHEHCVAQARFVLLFPECDSVCRREAWSIVSPVRR